MRKTVLIPSRTFYGQIAQYALSPMQLSEIKSVIIGWLGYFARMIKEISNGKSGEREK